MKLEINYAKTSGYPTYPLVKKVYLPADNRVIVKHRNSGESSDTVTDFDFRNLPTEVESIERTYAEMLHRASIVNGNVTATFVFAVADAASVTFGSLQESIVTSDFPNYIYIASGETESTETGATVPTWLGSTPILTATRSVWQARLGAVYVAGMEQIKTWWPKNYAVDSSERQRSEDVINVEIPNWWKATVAICSAAAAGRNWTGMTATQIEACVTHLEGLIAAGIVETWYGVGRGQTTSSSTQVPGTTRNATSYALNTTFGAALCYTDAFTVTSNVLTPRTPDYSWNAIVCTTPSNWNPESPS